MKLKDLMEKCYLNGRQEPRRVRLSTFPDWWKAEGEALSRQYAPGAFIDAMVDPNRLAECANCLDRHQLGDRSHASTCPRDDCDSTEWTAIEGAEAPLPYSNPQIPPKWGTWSLKPEDGEVTPNTLRPQVWTTSDGSRAMPDGEHPEGPTFENARAAWIWMAKRDPCARTAVSCQLPDHHAGACVPWEVTP